MSSLYNSLNEINSIKSKRVFLEEDQNEVNNYVHRKKIKKAEDENKNECNSLNFKQNLLPPSPPLDYMHCQCQTYYEDEEFIKFSLDQYQTESTWNIQKEYNNKDCNIKENNKISIYNTNIQRRKKYTPKFTIGYRSDCKKCRDGVPNHYGHIN